MRHYSFLLGSFVNLQCIFPPPSRERSLLELVLVEIIWVLEIHPYASLPPPASMLLVPRLFCHHPPGIAFIQFLGFLHGDCLLSFCVASSFALSFAFFSHLWYLPRQLSRCDVFPWAVTMKPHCFFSRIIENLSLKNVFFWLYLYLCEYDTFGNALSLLDEYNSWYQIVSMTWTLILMWGFFFYPKYYSLMCTSLFQLDA